MALLQRRAGTNEFGQILRPCVALDVHISIYLREFDWAKLIDCDPIIGTDTLFCQPSWDSVYGIIQEIGAGQPTCIEGDLPAKCFVRASHELNTECASYCTERDSFLRVRGDNLLPFICQIGCLLIHCLCIFIHVGRSCCG